MSGAVGGALSGAAAGTAIAPGYGTAIGAALGLVSSLMSSDGSAQQARISSAQLQQAENAQRYQQALTALALQRSVAGSTDAQGSTVRYDPSTNTWVSSLGSEPARVQAGQNQADVTRNTVDLPQATANNAATSIMASLARRNASGANNALAAYRDITPDAQLGALQQASTIANKQVQDPLIADTLRSFARTGTAAGPVLGQIGRNSSEALADEMANNVVKAQSSAAGVNTANRQALAGSAATFSGMGTPSTSLPASAGASPAAQLAAEVNGREASSAGAATAGAYSSPFGTNAANNAAHLAVNYPGNPNFGATKLSGIGQNLGAIINNPNIQGLFGGGSSEGTGSTLNPFSDAYTTGGSTDAIPPDLMQRLTAMANATPTDAG